MDYASASSTWKRGHLIRTCEIQTNWCIATFLQAIMRKVIELFQEKPKPLVWREQLSCFATKVIFLLRKLTYLRRQCIC